MFTKADIEKYFMAEKQAGLFFLIIGITAFLLAVAFFFFGKTAFYKGAAIPLLVIGIIQCLVGFTVYKRSDTNRIDNVYAYDMNPAKLKNEELPRMKKVNSNFVIITWVEIVLILAGLALLFLFKNNPDKIFWAGLGFTLTIQAAIMLGADNFAEKRAKAYAGGIESFVNKKR